MPATPEFLLGTTVQIFSSISRATVDSAKITIKDPNGTNKVVSADMVKTADYVYAYNYQSASTDVAGTYIITIEVTLSDYTSVVQDTFTLLSQV